MENVNPALVSLSVSPSITNKIDAGTMLLAVSPSTTTIGSRVSFMSIDVGIYERTNGGVISTRNEPHIGEAIGFPYISVASEMQAVYVLPSRQDVRGVKISVSFA